MTGVQTSMQILTMTNPGSHIIDYTVVTACNLKYLVETAYDHLEEGWQPFGGVCLTYERNIHRVIGENDINLPNDFEHYAQAFVKYETAGDRQ